MNMLMKALLYKAFKVKDSVEALKNLLDFHSV
jgi:hypothetical protein